MQPTLVSFISLQRHHALLTGVRNVVASAHAARMPSRDARSCAKRRRVCPRRDNAIAPCSLVWLTRSHLLTQPERRRVMLTRVRDVITHAHLARTPSRHAHSYGMLVAHAHFASASSRHAHSRANCPRACPSHISVRVPWPAGVRNVVAHAHLASASSCHAHSRAERDLERYGRPNQRVQPTPLAASEIGAFLKAGFVSIAIPIYEAARLTRNTLGRTQPERDIAANCQTMACRGQRSAFMPI